MAAPVVKVEGARRFRRTLRKAGSDLSELRGAHAKVAGLVASAARPPVRSGALAATVRGSGTKTAAIVRAGFATVPYAGPVHWGWPARGIEAQPFAVDAAQQTEPAWVAVYTAEVQNIVDKVKGV
jgi:hypothetical protein